jgi:hypothetical protein
LFYVFKNCFRKQFAKHFFNEKTTESGFLKTVLKNNSQIQKQKPVCQTGSMYFLLMLVLKAGALQKDISDYKWEDHIKIDQLD